MTSASRFLATLGMTGFGKGQPIEVVELLGEGQPRLSFRGPLRGPRTLIPGRARPTRPSDEMRLKEITESHLLR